MTTPESGFARHVAQIFHSCAPIGLQLNPPMEVVDMQAQRLDGFHYYKCDSLQQPKRRDDNGQGTDAPTTEESESEDTVCLWGRTAEQEAEAKKAQKVKVGLSDRNHLHRAAMHTTQLQ